jgi:multicomponent Na+:H+ antiporter subunit F
MTSRLLAIAVVFAFVALTIGLVACFVRVVRGPTLADRVLAVDLMTVAGAGLMAMSAVSFDDSVFLDIALFLIVTGFVGTAAFAQFIERSGSAGPRSTPAGSAEVRSVLRRGAP